MVVSVAIQADMSLAGKWSRSQDLTGALVIWSLTLTGSKICSFLTREGVLDVTIFKLIKFEPYFIDLLFEEVGKLIRVREVAFGDIVGRVMHLATKQLVANIKPLQNYRLAELRPGVLGFNLLDEVLPRAETPLKTVAMYSQSKFLIFPFGSPIV